MDRQITIRSVAVTIDDYGTPTEVATVLATVRAQVVTSDTEEFIRSYGASDQKATVFRTWWIDGVTNAHQIVFDGKLHDIKETKEIGRRNGLEIRTVSFGVSV